MRMLFLGPNLGAGGAERQWSILLPGLRARGHDARLIALDGGGPFLDPLLRAGVPVEVAGMRHQADLRPLLRSPIVRRFAPEVVVSRGVSGAWIGTAIATRHRSRNVFNDHRQVGFELSQRREWMLRLIAKRLDLVVGVTEDQAAAWVRRGFPAERVLAIPNGVPKPDVEESVTDIRAELGIPQDAVVAIHVASLRPEKRVPAFVSSVLAAGRRHPHLIGVVVGDGVDRAKVERARGDSPAIRLLGERSDVPRLLSASDLFVLASAYEAVPMAILEAMAAGLPVVATAVGAIPTMVEPEQSGLLVSPESEQELVAALTRLTADPELRARLGRRGTALHAQRWDAGVMIDRYERELVVGPATTRTMETAAR